jgi:hypothetical protein
MSLREELKTAAMLGANLALAAEGTALEGPMAELSRRPHPQRSLDAIALVYAYEEAGARALATVPLPTPCPVDPRPRCTAVAATHLSELLVESRGLLREWLSLANEAGLRPAEELVPALLNAGTRDRSLRQSIATAAGALGMWLAPFRPEWKWMQTLATDQTSWETGSLGERLTLLQELRGSDPGQARTLLQGTWPTENADSKRQFLQVLATGLSLEDEAFLESCLEERGVSVRRAAAELLASLPDSQLVWRMAERLTGCIRVSKVGLLRKTVLEVEPFAALDAAMARDGVEKKPPAAIQLGERAWWTAQALACVPPGKWEAELGMPPERLLEAARNGEWGDLLVEGWLSAAIRHRAKDWLLAFVSQTLPNYSPLAAQVMEVFRALEPNEQERSFLQLLEREAKTWLPHAATHCPQPWSDEFTRVVLKTVAKNLPKASTDPLSYQLPPFLREAALLASSKISALPQEELFAEFTEILNYRRTMREALEQKENR